MNSIWVSLFEKMEMKRKQKEKEMFIFFRSKLLSHEHMNT
jgi:hypothetical protein